MCSLIFFFFSDSASTQLCTSFHSLSLHDARPIFMFAWCIIAIATLAFFAFISIIGVLTFAMTTYAAGRIETVRRLDASVNALLARAAPANGDGVVYLPVGAANPADRKSTRLNSSH